MNQSSENLQNDWEIDANGLWIATRSFLIRRGYCCANQCRNCPYVNWRNNHAWQPAPAEAVQFTNVSPKAIQAIHQQIAHYTQKLQEHTNDTSKTVYHQTMLAHYTLLLQRWE